MAMNKIDQIALEAAVEQAEKGEREGGIPIGASLVDPAGNVVAAAHNRRVQDGDPTAHGEMSCIRAAGRRRDWHTLTMATTLSPCPMCTGAMVLFRIPRLIIGENTTFMGREDWLQAEGVDIELAGDPRCIAMMERFIAEQPDLWNEDIGVPES